MKIKTILLLLFLASLPFQLGTYFFFDFSYIRAIRTDYLAPALFISDCMALLLIGAYWKEVFTFIRKKPVQIVLWLLLIPVLFAFTREVAFYRYIKILEWVSLFAIFFQFAKTTPSKTLLKYILIVLVATTCFEFILSILQLMNKSALQGMFYWFGERAISVTTPDAAVGRAATSLFLRPYGTFSHPNSLAGFYLLLYFFLATWEQAKTHLRLRNITMFLSMLLVFMSFSKVAIATFLLLNILIFVQVLINKKCKFCGVARAITLICIAVIFFIPQGDPSTVDKRITLIDNSVEIIMHFPVFGIGLGNYLYAQATFPNKYSSYFLQPVHNILLLYIAEVGMVIGGIILFFITKKVLPLLSNKAFLMCFAVILLTGLFDHYWLTLQQNILITAVVFGLISAQALSIIKKIKN